MDVVKILDILEETYGGTTTALAFQSPFQLLVSTMLAAQSTDVQVNLVTQELFRDYDDAQSISRLSVQQLESYIKTVGLFHSKAKNIIAASKLLVERYRGEIPETREELMALPGVGRKTANVVLSIAMNFPAIAVDTHVFRVSNRLGLAQAKNVLEAEQQLMEKIPQEKWAAAHHWLIWHGRKVCNSRKPLCSDCSLKNYCLYHFKLPIRT